MENERNKYERIQNLWNSLLLRENPSADNVAVLSRIHSFLLRHNEIINNPEIWGKISTIRNKIKNVIQINQFILYWSLICKSILIPFLILQFSVDDLKWDIPWSLLDLLLLRIFYDQWYSLRIKPLLDKKEEIYKRLQIALKN